VEIVNPSRGYELIDFGDGRKLERFGEMVVDRPCPAASVPKASKHVWLSAELIFKAPRMGEERGGGWIYRGQQVHPLDRIEPWLCHHHGLVFEIRPQRTGQVGVFPEHWLGWPWIQERLGEQDLRGNMGAETAVPSSVFAAQPLKALHLFAYTGATTLALAAMGMHVTHVDAMESAVGWARENARLSAMGECPIRWIVDDARAYVARELRRGNQYDLILLDPPSYGHGSRGQAWEIGRDLMPMLQDVWSLLSERAIGVLLTGHSPDVDLRAIHRGLAAFAGGTGSVRFDSLQAKLTDAAGRGLDCGYVARFLRPRVSEG